VKTRSYVRCTGGKLVAASSLHEAVRCVTCTVQVAGSSGDGALQRSALVGLCNLAHSAHDPTAAVTALANYRQLVPGPTPCAAAGCGEAALERVLVMPCCAAQLHAACANTLELDGTCVACARHVCGRRYVGLPACQRCVAADE
jgi:hypothetical protein